MARHRNDSRQMTELLQPDRVHQENAESERRPYDREDSSQGSSSPAFNSASFSTPTSPSPSASSSSASAAFCFTSAASNPPTSPSFSTSTSSYTTATTSTFSAHHGGGSPTQPKWQKPLSNLREDCRASCPLEKLKRLPQCSGLEPLKCSATHTVLINSLATIGVHWVEFFKNGYMDWEMSPGASINIVVDDFSRGKGIKPQEGKDVWMSSFVKMPCSPSNFMTVMAEKSQQMGRVLRWTMISKQLKGLAKKKEVNVQDVEEAILMYNQKYKARWSFDALSTFVMRIPKTENYFDKLFPKIAALALKLPDYVKKAIPMLQSGHPASITLSQVQISCLLANAFFCTFPHRNTTPPHGEYHSFPSINFTSLFGNWSEGKQEKLRAIMHYFKVVTDEKTELDGLVTFERRCLQETDMHIWRSCKSTMPQMHITSPGTIENEGTGMLQVDFASRWIGGGVLSSGLVQEEILFLMSPELIVSRLFTERLADNECLIITGSQRFSCYSGYSYNFEWAGPYEDHLPRDGWARRQRQILAIDAQHYTHRREQYNMRSMLRELNKAYCGFKGRGDDEPDIATGKWGCGAFNGDPQLKAVIQMMAAAKAKRGLAFFTFTDDRLKRDLEQIYHLLLTKRTTVGTLFDLLKDFCDVQGQQHELLFDFIRNALKNPRSQL